MCNDPRHPIFVVDRDQTPQIWDHIRHAVMDMDAPTCLTYWPLIDVDNDPRSLREAIRDEGNPNRQSALLHYAREDGGRRREGDSRDEYPFACTLEGGTDSSVWLVPEIENRRQGGALSGFIRHNYLNRGDKFHVEGNPEF